MDNAKNIIVRRAVQEDKVAFKNLWSLCFEDSNAFREWFFENRFRPAHSVLLKAEDKVASCMQGFPYSLWIRGKEVPGAMLCGVSTHPEERKKGYMGKIFTYALNLLSDMYCAVAPHTPAALPSYFSYGHYPVADAAYLECDSLPSVSMPASVVPLERKDWEKCFPTYEDFAEKYSGMIKRSKDDFLLKMEDYHSDGGQVIAYIEEKKIKGYCFYYVIRKKVFCIEVVSADDCWETLLAGVMAHYPGYALRAKLPPNISVAFPFTSLRVEQKGVMGLCNISLLLQCLSLNIPYAFQIKDHVVEKNNGIFDFRGNRSEETPVFSISAGHFMQVLVGYHTLEELQNEIEIFDKEKFYKINVLLPKQNCYIIDEY